MAKYSVSTQLAAGADKGIIVLVGSAAIRCKLYDLILGSDATADSAGEFVVNRSTTAGTGGSGLTEVPLDPLTVAATAAATGGAWSTTEPADTANTELLMIGMNQRATFRWVAAPGSELISLASANNGLFLRTVSHTATPNINATMLWEE
jgi:hypothetical protein